LDHGATPPEEYDGLLTGAPAFNWDRFIPAELWGAVVMNKELGGPVSPAKLTAVTNGAVAACAGHIGDGTTSFSLTPACARTIPHS
jgi:hypothetical protein